MEALLGSAITKSGREDGRLRFYFPPILAPKLKRALQYARLRTHFLIKLSGKYSVTLYELLETAANRRYPVLEYTLVDLRRILKVPEGKLKRYQDIRRRTLEPAIEQINRNPLEAGLGPHGERSYDIKPLMRDRGLPWVSRYI